MLETAVRIAREAGEYALARRGEVSPEIKHDGTWVTAADRGVEELIRRRLGEAFPSHAICGEEEGGAACFTGGCDWVIDPIDGTANYVVGIPIWGVSIGLLRQGKPAAGVIFLPELGAMYTAEAGSGAFLNGAAIWVDGRGLVDPTSLVAFNSDAFQELEFNTPAMLRNLGSAAAHGCYVASGALAAAVFHKWRTWDLAAALCIAAEAGAVCKYLDGTALTTLEGVDPLGAGEAMVLGAAWAVEGLVRGVCTRSA